MEFIAKEFSELSLWELYEILKSRAEVFLLEQGIICQDLDDMDKESLHCFFTDGKRVTACLRAFKTGVDEVKIGRVLTLEHKNGLGRELMSQSFEEIKRYFDCRKIVVHAQTRSAGFYEKMGFSVTSDEFLEENVPHVIMEMEI